MADVQQVRGVVFYGCYPETGHPKFHFVALNHARTVQPGETPDQAWAALVEAAKLMRIGGCTTSTFRSAQRFQ